MATAKKYEFSVTVKTEYLSDQSNPAQQQYVFAYTIHITNVGLTAAQLISRHWIITDANGDIKEVKGLGVVGAQPLLEPQQEFEYTSGCVLKTSAGSMHGSYFCVATDGEKFEVEIPEFILSVPQVLH